MLVTADIRRGKTSSNQLVVVTEPTWWLVPLNSSSSNHNWSSCKAFVLEKFTLPKPVWGFRLWNILISHLKAFMCLFPVSLGLSRGLIWLHVPSFLVWFNLHITLTRERNRHSTIKLSYTDACMHYVSTGFTLERLIFMSILPSSKHACARNMWGVTMAPRLTIVLSSTWAAHHGLTLANSAHIHHIQRRSLICSLCAAAQGGSLGRGAFNSILFIYYLFI